MDSIKATWPGWNVVRVIGQGSFGAVYEIQREMFGKIESAALKVITIPQHKEEIQELRSEGYDDASLTTHFRSYLEDIAREYSLMLDIKLIILTLRIIFSKESTEGIDKAEENKRRAQELLKQVDEQE